MKIISIAILLTLALAAPALAQTWHPANQVTVAWDAAEPPECANCKTPPCTPTVMCPGPTWPSPAAGTMKYQVYVRSDLVSDGVKVGDETEATEQLIALETWGRYYIGVESVFYLAGETTPIRSKTIIWSNAAAPPFGVTFLPEILPPGGLRLK